MKSKILLSFFISLSSLIFEINLATGQDTIPPIISISQEQINDNYLRDQEDTYYELSSNNDTLTVYLSCRYSFPGEYYFFLDNATIQDESGILKDTIIVDTIIYDNKGYGTIIQTIIAEDNFGNTSNFVIISKIGAIYDFEFFGIRVDGIDVYYSDLYSSLEQTDFEFCEIKNVGVDVIYSMNGCTGTSRINWYKNDTLVSPNSENISINLGSEPEITELSLEAPFNNTNFQERIKLNIGKITKDSFVEIINPTCSNPAEGIIKFDENVVEVTLLEHNGSDKSADYKYNNLNELYFDFLESGTYYVSYVYYNESIYDYCEFNDTITIVPENIFEFSLSDTVVNLSNNEILTITNISTLSGDYFWQIGDSSFINNSIKFDYYFKSSGNYEIKLTDNSSICNDVIYKNIVVEGDIPELDTIPPTFTIYVDGRGGDFFEPYISSGKSKDTLEIRFSCLYSFPGEYGPSYVNVEDDSEVLISNISLNKIIRDSINGVETGYGSVIQTIYAKDIYGNISELIVKSTIGDIYSFDFDAMKVGDIEVFYDYSTNSLSQTDFEFCETQNLEVEVLYNKNGCTGNSRIDWYKNNVLALKNDEKISIYLDTEAEEIELAAEANFNNLNFQDRIKLNIRKITKDSLVKVINPTCSNSTDGIITFDPNVVDISSLKHNGLDITFDSKYNNLNELYFDILEAGTYYVTYYYESPFMNTGGCQYIDTITLNPGNILDFVVSDSIIDLSKSEKLTISNLSNNIEESLWQIGDSIFINNENEFDYVFKSPGNYKIKLTDNNGFCNDTIVKNITVEKSTTVFDNSIPSIKIGPNPFTDVLNFEMQKSSEYKITIYGVDGRVYFTDQVRDMKNFNVDLSFLNSGIYVLKIAAEENSELINGYKIVKFDY